VVLDPLLITHLYSTQQLSEGQEKKKKKKNNKKARGVAMSRVKDAKIGIE
jgi:hypothetical protein